MRSRAVKITYKGAEISAKVLSEIIRYFLQNKEKIIYGKQSLKELNRKGKALESIPVINADYKGLQSELKKFGVDYAVRKSITEKDTYEIYFKGTDIQQIQTALKNYMTKSLRQKEQSTIRQRIAAAMEKARERNEGRSQQLERRIERGR